jgi:hypothetical protein
VIVLLCQAAWQFDDAPHFMQRETSSDDVASLVNQIHTHCIPVMTLLTKEQNAHLLFEG